MSGFLGVNGSPATSFPFEAYINSSTAYSSTSRGNVLRVYNSNTGANIFAGIELGGAGTANDGLAGLNAVVTGSGSAALTFYTRDGGTFAERLRVAANGNVGIGTSSPTQILDVNGPRVRMGDGGGFELNFNATFAAFQISSAERIRITNLGYTKMSNSATYTNINGPYHEMWNNYNNQEIFILRHAGTAPFGLTMQYSAASPNGASNWFMYCEDSSAQRFSVRSNGGVYNYSANNVNLSDISTKKDIILCESYWDKFKAIEIVKFKYIDQTHNDYNIGVIAQQVEQIAPEFIDIENWAKPNEEEKILKAVYTEDLHHATIKVLQEAMAKIEELEAKVSALENKS